MKFKELKALPQNELRDKLLELKKELMKENAQVAIGTVSKNPRKIRNAKKAVARIETLLSRPAPKPVPAKVAQSPKTQTTEVPPKV